MKNLLMLGFNVLLGVVIACRPIAQSMSNSMLKPGDEIGDMIITTGAGQSPPLSAFCEANFNHADGSSIDCQVPPVASLAIGHTLGLTDPALQTTDWSALHWELSLDGQTIDLMAFGIYDFAQPDLAPSPSPIREIFRHVKAWDVVLINPASGRHTLSGMAYDEAVTYLWMANFTVEASHTP
jgi:hypothetical protein